VAAGRLPSPQAEREAALIAAMPAVFVLIWSTGFVVARYGMPHAPPLTFLAWRYGLSILAFVVWIRLARAAWPQGADQWRHLAVTGLLMHAGYLGGVWMAVRHGIGAGTSALIVGLQPVLTALWVSAARNEQGERGARGARGERGEPRVSARQWFGLALGLAGLTLVVWRKLGLGEVTAFNFGCGVFALLAITTGTLYQKRFVQPCDVRTANAVQLGAALLVTAPLALLETAPVDYRHAEFIGAMAWSVLALTLGGSSLLYLLIQRGAATRVTSLMYLVPPCTAVFGWILFDEPLGPLVLLGLALTALGVWLAVRSPMPAPAPSPRA
jgi:drug/metabolite transporter (DMT)-like permease